MLAMQGGEMSGDDLTTPGDRLRWARMHAGLSMGQAARFFGISVSLLSAMEVRNEGNAEWLSRFAELYYVSLRWLATGEEAEETAALQLLLSKLPPEERKMVRDLVVRVGP